jgi:FSR family fosmidomycin resistance protein-like MFS transporter
VNQTIALGEVEKARTTAVPILIGLSLSHLLNDMNQSLLSAIYPSVKAGMGLTFAEIGFVTLAYQAVASLLQPIVGLATDRKPHPHSLSFAMLATMTGLLTLSLANSYPLLVGAAMLVGVGSSIFHPESSRIARLASGGRHGLAQSLFQVGGNTGAAIGPLLAAFIVGARGQGAIAWFAIGPGLASLVLWKIGSWSIGQGVAAKKARATLGIEFTRRQKFSALAVLVTLVFSKHVYLASLSSYYTFYLIQTFGLSVRQAQLCLFVFLGAVAVGTIAGGPIGDRFGRKYVIWFSILGVLPFTLALPWVGLVPTILLTVIIGLVLSSAFSAIVVFGQELMPHRVGAVAGLFFGLAFGVGGLGAAGLGWLADRTSIGFVYRICSFLPALGLFAAFLPDLKRRA